MKSEELQFIGCDPGAVQHGNFINYYSFHSASERTNNLTSQMFPTSVDSETIICLDIGCNTGELTRSLKHYLATIYPKSNIKFLAIDIDPSLIQRAQDANDDSDILYMTLNILDGKESEKVNEFQKKYSKSRFDVTFCFSVTMWIHLNNGDAGLINFLQNIKSMSNTLVIEPQPWSCYRNAQRRVKKSGGTFPLYETLKIRSNVDRFIEDTLIEKGLQKIYESQSSSWKRKIQSYN